MKKDFLKKFLLSGWLAPVIFFASTQFASAQQSIGASVVASGVATAFDNIGYWVIGKIAFGISYLVAWVAGVLISVEAWLVGAIIGINQGVFQADIVQKGFAVTLSIANLGFVLGIIIIAVATILRRETYGYKSTLWKLVAAAILVNFSLVIAAPIFTLGNSFTTYFLTCVDPGGGGCGGANNGLTSMNNFAAKLAGAFNPQVGLIGRPSSTLSDDPGSISIGTSFGQMLIPILAVIFVAFELISIVVVLGALIAMLIVRYIYIAILAILMPFAWLGWVFPGIKNWWGSWWNQFIRWTFFAPIVVFFLWLAMATAQSMSNGTAIANQQFKTYTSASNPAWAPIANLLTGAFSPIIGQVLNTFLMLGLTIGGLIVADRMSIAGASGAVKSLQSVGKAVQGYVGKQGKKVARAGVQQADKRLKLTDRLQEGRIGPLKYIPFGRRGASYAGQGLANVKKAGGEHLVEQEMKWAKEAASNPEEGKKILAGDLNPEKKIALIRALMERQDLDDPNQTVNQVPLGQFIAKNKTMIAKDYGQFNFYDKELRKVGLNEQATPMAKLVAAGKLDEEVKDEDGKVVKALDGLRDSMRDLLVSKLKTADAPKIDMNGMLNEKYLAHADKDGDKVNKVRVEMFLQQLGAYNFQMVPALIRTLKGKQVSTFKKMYVEAMEKERIYQEQERQPSTDKDREDRQTALANLKLARANFDKILENLARGSGSGSRGGEKAADHAEPAGDAH